MMKKRFAVEQVASVLNQEELGLAVVEVMRKAGISEQESIGGRRSTLV